MKVMKLTEAIRKAAHHERQLIMTPGERTWRTWPVCMTCGREVDSCALENMNNKSCEIRAKCHGQEDAIRIEWDLRPDSNENIQEDPHVGWAIRRAMADFRPFDPVHIFGDRLL